MTSHSWWITVISLVLSAIIYSYSTPQCRQLFPIDIRLCDLEGFWYLVIITGPVFVRDCTGFFGEMFNPDQGTFTVTGRKGLNPTLDARVTNRQIFLYPTDGNCTGVHSFKVAVLEDCFVCFYMCGLKNTNDYAQCFSRKMRVSEAERQRMHKSLVFFGLTIDDPELKLVDRAGCFMMGK